MGVFLDLTLKPGSKRERTAALTHYLRKRLSEEGKRMTPEAEALLLERAGPAPAQLEMEIQKLAAYSGERDRITAEDVDGLVDLNREEPIYELTTALGEKNSRAALVILDRLWDQGLHPLVILSGLANAYRRLLLTREIIDTLPPPLSQPGMDFPRFTNKIWPRLQENPLPGPLTKLKPYALFNLLRAAQRFSREELFRALEALHRIDRGLKSTGADGRSLLEDFILTRNL